jgi:thioredoxin reductase (NADPH)
MKGKPGIRSDWKKTIGDTVFHYWIKKREL